MGKKLRQRSHFHFADYKKRLKKQFLGAKIQIFEKRCSFRSQIFYELIPNLLGHPVDTTTRKKNDTGTFPPLLLCSTILQDSSKI